ncbi:MAG: hypothetical protein ACI85F_001392 [Bacteroidia bacterium]|jgi:hypothetical protein
MKLNLFRVLVCIILAFVFSDAFLTAQTIKFESGHLAISQGQFEFGSMNGETITRYISFEQIPGTLDLQKIEAAGIDLLQYVPANTYLAHIPNGMAQENLEELGIIQMIAPKFEHKASQELVELSEMTAEIGDQRLDLYFRTHNGVSLQGLRSVGDRFSWNVQDINPKNGLGHAVVSVRDLPAFAMQSMIRFVEMQPPVGEPESDDGRNLHRSNVIDVDYVGGRNYDGSGVSLVVNDDGYVGPHIDFKGRTEQSPVAEDFIGTHGDGVAGVMGSAGNLNPENRGMAPASFLYIRQYNAELPNTIELHQDSGAMVFNSSYSNGCNDGYTLTTQLVDQEIYENPALMQVFSAGNSNNNDCGYGAGDQWGNITGGHKAGKNCIATANLFSNDGLVSSSSRGPAFDGRIKPDISAHGQGQISNDPDNEYAEFGGTSAAAPGIAGVMGQLYQAYREINLEEAPSALLKCIMMNTANELGNIGPDFKYGWGKVNAFKAVSALENDRHANGTITQGETQQINIDIPSGVKLAKIMVYWSDLEADPAAEFDLVNDLDISLDDPSSSNHLPYVLDHTPNATTLDLPAVPGVDHLNNVEQVAINDPAAGSYTLNISGTAIPFGSQEYYVSYEFLTEEVDLLFPLGGEGFEPSSFHLIHWDAFGEFDVFELEISADNGSNWTWLANASEFSRAYQFQMPDVLTSQALVRVTRNGFTDMSDTTFSIIETPTDLAKLDACGNLDGYSVTVQWSPVINAVGYDVFLLGEHFMDSVQTVATTTASVQVPYGENGWFSVRAIGPNGEVGQRAIAVPIGWSGEDSPCLISCDSEEDAGIQAILSPVQNGFNCDLGDIPVSVMLQNIGTVAQTGFDITHEFDGNSVTETYTGTLEPGENEVFTFDQLIQSPASQGLYEFVVYIENATDQTFCNDTLSSIISFDQSTNSAPFTEDFEGPNFLAQGAEIENQDGLLEWEVMRVVGPSGDSTEAAFINNRDFEGDFNNVDTYRLLPLDLNGFDHAFLTFDVAHRPYPTGSRPDTLNVSVSADCGQTFDLAYSKIRTELSTGFPTSGPFSPEEADEWRKDSIDLTAFVNSNAVIQFENHSGSGNNIYIDNINLYLSNTGIEESDARIRIYPNPSSDFLIVDLRFAKNEELKYEVQDAFGRTVISSKIRASSKFQIETGNLPSGVYLLNLVSGEEFKTIQFEVIH